MVNVMEYNSGVGGLEGSVIYNGLCVGCGACAAFCDVFEMKDEIAHITKKCVEDCRMCYSFCPRTYFPLTEIEMKTFGKVREDPVLGNYIECFSVRAKEPAIQAVAQDGGSVTSILKHILQKGIVDGAVVAGKSKDNPWMPTPQVVTTYDELLRTAGTKYTVSSNIIGVAEAIRKYKLNKIAFVGVPCQIQALRKIQADPTYDVDIGRVKLLIGLFCMESFTNKGLIGETVIKKLNIKPTEIKKFDIKKGKFLIYVEGKEPISLSLEQVSVHVREACHFCLDFTAELADISCGAVGSAPGYSTVITRTNIGNSIFKEVVKAGGVEVKPLAEVKPGLDLVKRLSDRKQKGNMEHIMKRTDFIQLLYLKIPRETLQRYITPEVKAQLTAK
jgi:coenzyme F420 hydrogenase subunit beta